jgi:HK97 family phage portal protein
MRLPFGWGTRSDKTASTVQTDEVEKRQEYIGQWPTSPLSGLSFGIGRSYAEVDASAGENSLQSIAFRSGVDLMASLVSELPFYVYSGVGTARRKRSTPSYLLDPAGDGYGVEDWAYMLVQSWLLRGNGFGNILDQGPTGMLRQVDLYHPDRVNARFDDGSVVWTVNGREVPVKSMFHRRAFPVAGVLLGKSPVAAHADSIGLSIAATRFGKQWFQDGGHPGGILSNSEADMSDDRIIQTAKDRFMAALFGTREPVILGRGWKYEQIQIAPEESQFLQTQGFSEAQCARIVGAGVAEVLGYDTGTSMTYSNMVDRDISLLKYAADRWLRRMERVYSAFLPRPQYALFDRDAFLDTNIMQKWAVNKLKLDTGAYIINEVRAANNDQPVEWGKLPMALQLKPEPAPAEPPADPEPENDPEPPTGGNE